jgi:hypothetical protein
MAQTSFAAGTLLTEQSAFVPSKMIVTKLN